MGTGVYLGVRGIRLGPNLPAFVTPRVLSLLQGQFDLRPIGKDARVDVAAAMGAA